MTTEAHGCPYMKGSLDKTSADNAKAGSGCCSNGAAKESKTTTKVEKAKSASVEAPVNKGSNAVVLVDDPSGVATVAK